MHYKRVLVERIVFHQFFAQQVSGFDFGLFVSKAESAGGPCKRKWTRLADELRIIGLHSLESANVSVHRLTHEALLPYQTNKYGWAQPRFFGAWLSYGIFTLGRRSARPSN